MTTTAQNPPYTEDGGDLADAGALVDAVRDLCDRVIRLPAGAYSADFARELTALTEKLDAHVPDQTTPWFYGELSRQVAASGAVRDPLSAFHPMIPPLRSTITGTELHAVVRVGPAFTGPPGRVHGGTISTLLDHTMGLLVSTAVQPSFTARLEVDFVRATPIDAEVEIFVRVESVSGRKTWVDAEARVAGELCARGRALFIAV